VYYFAPQKALGSDGGIWLAVMSRPRSPGSKEIKASGRWIPAFLDLATAVEQSRLEQTYNTPALATIFLAAEQVDWTLHHGGLSWAAKRSAESAGVLYGWAERSPVATPFVVDRALRSTTVATIDFDRRSMPRRWRRRCAPMGSWTPIRTGSSVATSCGSRSSRPLNRPMWRL
jgi:phosphoserine aminotransferase